MMPLSSSWWQAEWVAEDASTAAALNNINKSKMKAEMNNIMMILCSGGGGYWCFGRGCWWAAINKGSNLIVIIDAHSLSEEEEEV